MPVSASVEDKDLGMQAVIDEIEREGGFVDIGVQSDEEETLLIIAASNEFGTKNIPARPYIRGAIDANEDMIMQKAKELSGQIIDLTITKFDALTIMGQLIEGATKRHMIDLRSPVNAPSTIKRKGSDNPLIDKSNLIGSIRYVVKSGEV